MCVHMEFEHTFFIVSANLHGTAACHQFCEYGQVDAQLSERITADILVRKDLYLLICASYFGRLGTVILPFQLKTLQLYAVGHMSSLNIDYSLTSTAKSTPRMTITVRSDKHWHFDHLSQPSLPHVLVRLAMLHDVLKLASVNSCVLPVAPSSTAHATMTAQK